MIRSTLVPRWMLAVALLGAVSALPLPAPAQETASAEVSPQKLLAEVRVLLPRASDEYGTPTYCLCQVAKIEALYGDTEAAKKTIAEVQKRIATRKPPYADSTRTSVFSNLALVQATIGDVDGALKTAAMVKDDGDRKNIIANIVKARAESGDLPGAEKLSERIKDTAERRRLFGELLEERLESSDLATSKTLLEKELKDPDNAAIDPVKVVRLLISLGDLPDAIRLSAAMKEGYSYTQTQSEIAVAQVKAGDKDAATKSLEGLDEHLDSSGTEFEINDLAALGKAKAALGDAVAAKQHFADASTKAQKIDDMARSGCYLAIAKAQAETGDTTGAKASFAIAKKVAARQDDFRRGEQLGEIAIAQAESGDLAGAKETAKLVKERIIINGRTLVVELAKALLKAGDEAGALSVIALQTDPFDREEGYSALAGQLASKGDVAGAVRMAGKIRPDSDAILGVKLEMAEALAKQGKK